MRTLAPRLIAAVNALAGDLEEVPREDKLRASQPKFDVRIVVPPRSVFNVTIERRGAFKRPWRLIIRSGFFARAAAVAMGSWCH